MKAKLKDVAALAGVAPNTASTILNRRSNSWASKATEKRVFDAAKTLGYTPSRAALALRLGLFRTIGLVIPDLHNPFYTTLADLLEQKFRAAGYDMIMEHARADIERERQCLSSILDRQVDGVVCAISDVELNREFLQKTFASRKGVTVITSQRTDKIEADTVQLDFTQGFSDAIRHLYGLGHRHFVFLSALAKGQDDGDRTRTFTRLLNEYQVPSQNIHYVNCDHSWKSARDAFREYLLSNRDNLPTALIAINDLSAIAAIRAANELGLSVPEDLSVVGVDNILLGSYLPRSLSTIEQPLAQMAEAAADLMLKRLEEKKTPDNGDGKAGKRPPEQRTLAARFIAKETTGAPRSGDAKLVL